MDNSFHQAMQNILHPRNNNGTVESPAYPQYCKTTRPHSANQPSEGHTSEDAGEQEKTDADSENSDKEDH